MTRIFPEVNQELNYWTGLARQGLDWRLREQALSSIATKKFHAQGGSVYALYSKSNQSRAVKFIVALQTISDYLDNLCDRAGFYDENAFRELHLAMADAVDCQRDFGDYYRLYPYRMDSGYLLQLVKECRAQLDELPAYHLVASHIQRYIRLYSELQTRKHLALGERESSLKSWANLNLADFPELSWWEFSAASGSTLGVFILYAAATDPLLTKEDVEAIDTAYFPWITGLHILLDYFIDALEDQQMGDLNFTGYYRGLPETEERLGFLLEQALYHCQYLPHPEFHLTVIQGLLAMYLSDPKVNNRPLCQTSRRLIQKGGFSTVFYYHSCRLLRLFKLL